MLEFQRLRQAASDPAKALLGVSFLGKFFSFLFVQIKRIEDPLLEGTRCNRALHRMDAVFKNASTTSRDGPRVLYYGVVGAQDVLYNGAEVPEMELTMTQESSA